MIDELKAQRSLYRFRWAEGILQDVRFALRTLQGSRGFTIVAVLTVALGVGINTAVFTVTNAALFKGFPLVRENNRILYITNKGVPYPDFQDWQAQTRSFSQMAATQGKFTFVSGSPGTPEVYSGTSLTPNSFQLLGVNPAFGRDFMSSDAEPGAEPVVILSYELWEHRFNKDASVLGRKLPLDGIPTTVIGIMPAGFCFPQKLDLWLPIVTTSDALRRDRPFVAFAVGRLANGATIEGARAEMQVIGERLQHEYPKTYQGIPVVKDFNKMFIGANATSLYKAMWGAVSFVLLIACANVANLLLGRAASRSREISIRLAIGAGRLRIIRQLLVESMLIASVGGGIGWWIAKAGVQVYLLTQRSDSLFAAALSFATDYRVFAYLIAISVGTGIIFGLVPALRLSKPDVNSALKNGGAGGIGGHDGKRLTSVLIAGEVTLAVVLLAASGLAIRSFLNIYKANVGIRTDNLVAAYVYLPSDRYPNGGSQIGFFDRLKPRLEAVPGVEAVAVGIAPTETVARSSYEIADAAAVDEANAPVSLATLASPGYFRTLGARLLSGREFSDLDGPSSLQVCIVNERFASRNWPGKSPLGERVRFIRDGQQQIWLTVVGVVSNVVQNDPTRQQFEPIIYQPFRQRPVGGLGIVARTRVSPDSLATAFQRELRSVDSQLPFQHLVPLAQWMSVVGGTYELNRNIAVLFLVFGSTALLLAAIGLYAVIAHSVSQRVREIGIRMALGATPQDIRGLVLRFGMLPFGIGLGIGLLASWAVNRLLETQLVRVSPADPLILGAVFVVLVASALLGCSIPARRAMRVDPLIALKHE